MGRTQRWENKDLKDLRLYLMRHGESTANLENVFASHRIDVPLSDNGTQQVEEAAKWLKSFPISVAYASPLLRAKQTAEIVCTGLSLTPIFSDLLVEVDVGGLEGKSQATPENGTAFDRIMKLWERGLRQEGFDGGETLLQVETRLSELLDKVEEHGSGHVLLVGHCLLFMAFIWLFCENHGPTLESGHMGRARLSILRRTNKMYRLEKFDLAPPTQNKRQ